MQQSNHGKGLLPFSNAENVPIYARIGDMTIGTQSKIDPNDGYEIPNILPSEFHHRVFNEEERQLAFELFTNCQPYKEQNRCKTAIIFFKLGNIYREKSPEKISLIRAAALFNAARIRNTALEDEITLHLNELSNHVQTLANAKQKKNLVDKAYKLSEEVEAMRKNVQQAVIALQPIEENLEKSQLRYFESVKITAVQNIQQIITKDYIKMMSDLSQFCELIMGTPPCLYAIVGMGSLARNEVTPYSDFEHAILLQECRQKSSQEVESILEYFRWYSVIFHVIVINLKETIVPSLAIPSLNNFSSSTGNWFFDVYTKRGISFDGMMPHACKFPLGRQDKTADKPFTAELIQPVSKMLEYLDINKSIKYGYHLSDILTKTCFVFGNNEIYCEFSEGVKRRIQQAYETNCFQELKTQLKDDLVKFAIDKNAFKLLKSNENFNVKHLFYRSTTLFISAWGRLEGIESSSSFDIISALSDKKIISSYQKHKLMYAIALACEIRLRIYLEKSKQDDMCSSFFIQESGCHQLLKVIGTASFVNYFQIAYALQLETSKKINVELAHLISDPTMLNVNICSVLGLQDVVKKLLQVCLISSTPKIDMYSFDDCLNYLENEMRDQYISTSNPTTEMGDHAIANRISQVAEHFYGMHKYNTAFECIVQALSISNSISPYSMFQGRCNELAGCCLMQMEKYRKGWFYFEKALKIYQVMSSNETVMEWQIELSYHSLGICLVRCEYFSKANYYFNKALTIYEEQNSHKIIAEINFYIGLCLYHAKDYPLSNLYLKKSLKTYKKLTNCGQICFKEHIECLLYLTLNHSMKNNRPNDIIVFRDILVNHMKLIPSCGTESAATIFSIGRCLLDLNYLDFSIYFLTETLRISEKITGRAIERTISDIYCTIGLCLQKKHEYCQSLACFDDALSLLKATSTNVEKDIEIAVAYQRIGSCMLEMKLIQGAYTNFQNALAIASTTEKSRKKLAALHNDIGVCVMEMHDYKTAMKHLQTSLDIKLSAFSNKMFFINTDITLNNIGMCMMKLYRHKEALEMFHKALKIQENLNSNSQLINDKVVTLNNLGLCLLEINEFQESFTYFEKAYEICLQALASGSTVGQVTRKHMADTLNNLGLQYMCIKEYQYAMESFYEALTYYDSISTFSEENEDIYFVYNNLGLCYLTTKQYNNALNLFKLSLKFFEASSTSDSIRLSIAALCNNIGLCLMQVKCYKDSLYFFTQSLAIYRDEIQNCHQDVAAVLHNIGLVHMRLGDLNQSFQSLSEALDLFYHSCGNSDTDPNLSQILHSMGVCKKLMGAFTESLSYFKRSFVIRRKSSMQVTDDMLKTIFDCGLCFLDWTVSKEFDPNNLALQ